MKNIKTKMEKSSDFADEDIDSNDFEFNLDDDIENNLSIKMSNM